MGANRAPLGCMACMWVGLSHGQMVDAMGCLELTVSVTLTSRSSSKSDTRAQQYMHMHMRHANSTLQSPTRVKSSGRPACARFSKFFLALALVASMPRAAAASWAGERLFDPIRNLTFCESRIDRGHIQQGDRRVQWAVTSTVRA